MHRIAPCAPYLPRRASDTNKYDYGRVLIVGGCIGYTGAPTLCARAALRCGAGLVSVGVPEAIYAVTAVKNDEAMPFPLPSAEGKLARDAVQTAVWLHGRAGDLCAGRMGEYAMNPTDVIAALPEVTKPIIR